MTPAELDTLFRTYGHVVLRRASAILRNRADAEELTQELFASFLTRDVVPDGRAAIVTYLYQATTNRAINFLRDQKNRKRLLERDKPERPAAEPADVRAIALDMLGRLPQELAVVAVHAFVDEMTHQEIADLLHCSRRHVGDLIGRVVAQATATENVS